MTPNTTPSTRYCSSFRCLCWIRKCLLFLMPLARVFGRRRSFRRRFAKQRFLLRRKLQETKNKYHIDVDSKECTKFNFSMMIGRACQGLLQIVHFTLCNVTCGGGWRRDIDGLWRSHKFNQSTSLVRVRSGCQLSRGMHVACFESTVYVLASVVLFYANSSV